MARDPSTPTVVTQCDTPRSIGLSQTRLATPAGLSLGMAPAVAPAGRGVGVAVACQLGSLALAKGDHKACWRYWSLASRIDRTHLDPLARIRREMDCAA